MPSDFTCSSRIGSASSITATDSCSAANFRINSSGNGHDQPSFRISASGKISVQCSAVSPEEMIPSPPFSVPRSTKFKSAAREASAACSATRSSTRTRSLRPQTGIGTNCGGFFSKFAVPAPVRAPTSTSAREWLTLVVVRKITGVRYFSLISNARLMKADASRALPGSKTGTFASRAYCRVSCSVCEECIPGSSAATITSPPTMPI